jgi:tetratricopeptide (TPR) repeat protein
MQGQVKEGRQLTVEGLDEAIERGTADWIGVATLACGYAALLEGDVEAAERDFAAAQRTFADQGDRWYLSVANADLALALCSLGRHDEARAACSGPQAPSDAEWVTKWNRVQALLNAASGLLDTAIQHADVAVQAAAATDYINHQAAALADRATIRQLHCRTTQARADLTAALALYREKGNIVDAGRVQRRLEQLERPAGR